MILYGFQQSTLYFKTCAILMMKNTVFGMSAFFCQIKFSTYCFIKLGSPCN